ncbi:laccase domain-containing protein 1 [Plakobranchus ocellatus]|uniref:Laccase domain-containing protein 1 n=1 Tax=Plakobranchus ocellatus TaxID=259542 RepID=A0AAV3XWM7_9GAST|nr:laccase domain-containing protein 1 [Plakobranchus ocellatus]
MLLRPLTMMRQTSYTTMNPQCSGVILDLATDQARSTVAQLTTAAQDRLAFLRQQERHHQNNNNSKHDKIPCVVVTSHKLQEEDITSIQFSKCIISNDCIELLFKAKTYLDENPGFGCKIQVVTSLGMKKFWEAACVQIFSPVTEWSVWGVDVKDQAATLREPAPEGDVKNMVKNYLKTVGNIADVNIWRSALIPEDQFNAGFHDRYGGVSQLGPMASLNMVYTVRKPDSVLVVEENRRRLAEAAGFDPESMYVTKAEHDRRIWVVGKEQPDRYDGIVTDQPGVTVCAAGADCCMILLADTHTGAVGAVHAGWRGTTVAAVTALLRTMMHEYGTQPKNVSATIGPCVCSNHYDLPAEDAKPVTDLDPTLTWPSKENPGHVNIDLVGANVIMLQREGVPKQNIDTSYALCTVENSEFFSHKRDGIPFGNQVGFISRRLAR